MFKNPNIRTKSEFLAALGHQYQAEDHGQVATGGHGSVPGSSSPSIFHV